MVTTLDDCRLALIASTILAGYLRSKQKPSYVNNHAIQVVVLASLAQLLGRVKFARFARSIATDKKKCLYVFCMEHFACS